MPSSRIRRGQVTNYWPGFVDALSSLLLVIIFLLSLFMLAQFFLGQQIKGKDTALTRLNSQIAELTNMLQLERSNSSDLQNQLTALQATLVSTAAPALAVMHIPPQFLALIIVAETIPDMVKTVCNITMDVAATAVVDRDRQTPGLSEN